MEITSKIVTEQFDSCGKVCDLSWGSAQLKYWQNTNYPG